MHQVALLFVSIVSSSPLSYLPFVCWLGTHEHSRRHFYGMPQALLGSVVVFELANWNFLLLSTHTRECILEEAGHRLPLQQVFAPSEVTFMLIWNHHIFFIWASLMLVNYHTVLIHFTTVSPAQYKILIQPHVHSRSRLIRVEAIDLSPPALLLLLLLRWLFFSHSLTQRIQFAMGERREKCIHSKFE